MAKQKIDWYKEGQKNFRRSIDDDIHKCQELKEQIKRDEERYAFKQKQIEEAEKQGKETFDDERFLIKRNKIGGRNSSHA